MDTDTSSALSRKGSNNPVKHHSEGLEEEEERELSHGLPTQSTSHDALY